MIVNLGLPTVLARMIDEGVNKGMNSNCMFGPIMLVIILCGTLGRIVLAYAASKLTTNMVKDMRDDLYAKLQEYSHHEYEKIECLHWLLALPVMPFPYAVCKNRP